MEKESHNNSFLLSLGKRLKTTRESKSMTLDKLALVSRVSKSSLSKIERGLQDPSVTTILAICSALKVNHSSILASQTDNYIMGSTTISPLDVT